MGSGSQWKAKASEKCSRFTSGEAGGDRQIGCRLRYSRLLDEEMLIKYCRCEIIHAALGNSKCFLSVLLNIVVLVLILSAFVLLFINSICSSKSSCGTYCSLFFLFSLTFALNFCLIFVSQCYHIINTAGNLARIPCTPFNSVESSTN